MPSPDEFLVFIVMTDTLGFTLIIVLGNRLQNGSSYAIGPLSVLSETWPYGWMDQHETWHAGRPRPWPHCVRLIDRVIVGQITAYFRGIFQMWIQASNLA